MAVHLRVEPEIGVADGLVDRLGEALVPHLDRDHAGLRRGDVADLVNGHQVAIGLDPHRVEQRRAGAAGPKAGELLFQGVNGAHHPAVQFVLAVCLSHDASPCAVPELCQARSSMVVERPLPLRTRASDPRSWIENTMIGILFSRLSEIADASMT